jgi:hypothetical protein
MSKYKVFILSDAEIKLIETCIYTRLDEYSYKKEECEDLRRLRRAIERMQKLPDNNESRRKI